MRLRRRRNLEFPKKSKNSNCLTGGNLTGEILFGDNLSGEILFGEEFPKFRIPISAAFRLARSMMIPRSLQIPRECSADRQIPVGTICDMGRCNSLQHIKLPKG